MKEIEYAIFFESMRLCLPFRLRLCLMTVGLKACVTTGHQALASHRKLGISAAVPWKGGVDQRALPLETPRMDLEEMQ
jgi:hypothetical protein